MHQQIKDLVASFSEDSFEIIFFDPRHLIVITKKCCGMQYVMKRQKAWSLTT